MCGGTFYQLAPDGSRIPYQYAGGREMHVSAAGDHGSTKTSDNQQVSDERQETAKSWDADDGAQTQNTTQTNNTEHSKPPPKKQTLKQKTMAMLDEELRLKMEGISGEGGESGVEYEDGKPVAMKRSVKENMFRYIWLYVRYFIHHLQMCIDSDNYADLTQYR